MVLDSYSLGIEWETALKPFVEKIAVFDDLADRNHNCDLFVDQNYTDRSQRDYLQRIPDSAQVLIGPRYALLDRQFRKLRNTERSALSKPPRVLVFAGGLIRKT